MSPTDPKGSAELTPHQRQFIRFAQYNRWFNGRLYDACEKLDDAERKRDRGAFFRSIHDTLDHVLLADRSWLGRIQRSDLDFPALAGAELVYDVRDMGQGLTQDWAELRAKRSDTDAVLEAFAFALTPERLAADLSYRNSRGMAFTTPLWFVVAHLFNHQTHHRGQVTTLLMQAGIDPGMTDLVVASLMPFPERPEGA